RSGAVDAHGTRAGLVAEGEGDEPAPGDDEGDRHVAGDDEADDRVGVVDAGDDHGRRRHRNHHDHEGPRPHVVQVALRAPGRVAVPPGGDAVVVDRRELVHAVATGRVRVGDRPRVPLVVHETLVRATAGDDEAHDDRTVRAHSYDRGLHRAR